MAGLENTAAIHQAWVNAGASEILADGLYLMTLGSRDPLKEGLEVIRELEALRLTIR